MSGTSKHLISVAIICLVIVSVNHIFCEHGSTLKNNALTGGNLQMDSLGLAVFLAGSTRLGITLGTLFLVKIFKPDRAES
jgi:hypothetical protein